MIGSDQKKRDEGAPISRGRSHHAPLAFAIFVFLFACIASAYAYLKCQTYGPPIRSDGYGYYAYLPSVFIDGDLSMKSPKAFHWTVVGNQPLPYEWDGISMYSPTGKYLDKYSIGTAVLESPFFAAALVAAKFLGFPTNGYSLPFQIAIQLSGMAYMATGAFLLFRYLALQFNLKTAFLTTTAAVLGTNVIHFGTYHGSHSHAYSFCLFALLLNCARAYRSSASSRRDIANSVSLGALVGLITLVRIPNVICALVPVVFALERFNRSRSMRHLLLEACLGISSFLVLMSPQLAYWHAITGHLLINSYLGESFDWAHPQIIPFLFSLRRGFFVWTPIALFAVAGLPLLLRRDRPLAIAVCLVLSAEVYICSSWWSWWFGASFGSRPLADMMPLLAPPLACCLEWLGIRLSRTVPACVVSSFILLNLFLMFSLWNNYLPWDNVQIADFLQLPSKWEPRVLLAWLHELFLPPYRLGTPFEADKPAPMSIITEGFQEQPAPAIWSIKKQAAIYIRPVLPDSGDTCVDFRLAGPGALLTSRHPLQRAVVRVNGVRIGDLRFVLNGSNQHRAIPIPRGLFHNQRVAKIGFELPDAIAPEALGINHDPRSLALYVSRVSIERWHPESHTCGN